jgi:hypothetical protein
MATDYVYLLTFDTDMTLLAAARLPQGDVVDYTLHNWPDRTHHAVDKAVYDQVAPELHLWRLIQGALVRIQPSLL